MSDQPQLWRMFYGDWYPNPALRLVTYANVRGVTWEQARDSARTILQRFAADECPCCAAEAVEELSRLDWCARNTPYKGSLQADDLIVVRDDGAEEREPEENQALDTVDWSGWVELGCTTEDQPHEALGNVTM